MRVILLVIACCLGLVLPATAFVTVNAGATADNGVSAASGSELEMGNYVRVGHFTVSDSDLKAHASDLDYLNANFVDFGSARIGDAFNVPGHFDRSISNAGSDGLGLAHQQIHFWILRSGNTSSLAQALATAFEHGVFYADKALVPDWQFPAGSDIPNVTSVDLTDLTTADDSVLSAAARVLIGSFPKGKSRSTGAANFGLAPVVSGLPDCQTLKPSGIAADGATLRARVNAHGKSTMVTFSRGATVLGSVSAGAGDGAVTVTLAVTGLQAETSYGVQAVAKNSVGSTPGGTVTFLTANAPRTAMPAVGVSVVAASGEPVPGEAGGTVYASFGVPSTVGPGWLASVTSGGQTGRAIFSGQPVQRRVSVGDTVPGLPKLTFAAFQDPVFADATHYAFSARLTPAVAGVNDRALFSSSFGTLRMLARTNGVAPDTGGARYERFVSLALPSSGGAVFLARLQTGVAGVNSGNNTALYQELADGAHLVLRTGSDLTAGGQVRRIKTLRFLQAVAGSPGHGRYDAASGTVYGAVDFTDGTEALVTVAADGTVTVVLASGEDTNGAKTARFGAPAALGGSNGPVVRVGLDASMGGVDSSNDSAVLGRPNGPVLAREGAAATGVSGGVFKSFKDPVAGLMGAAVPLAFAGTLGGTVTDSNDQALFWQPDPAQAAVALLARENATAPESGGAKFFRFQSLAFAAQRGPVFAAQLKAGTGRVSAASAAGLWAVDSTGQLRCLMRANDAVDFGGFSRILSSFSVLRAVTGSPAQQRAFAGSKGLVRAVFTDGSSALLEVTVP